MTTEMDTRPPVVPPPSPSSSSPLPTDEGARPAIRPDAGAAPLQVSLNQPDSSTNAVSEVPAPPADRSAPPAPTPPPPFAPRASFSRQSATFEIPAQLVKPGMEMLKVSAKSARRVKPRRVWLELASETPEDGEMGLEVGIGVVGGQDVRLCWEKQGAGLGFARTPNYASVPLTRIRDLRFAAAGSPYRTSLHLPPSVEPRWATIIYAAPASTRFLGSVTGAPTYKLAHFIALSPHDLDLLQKTLEGFKEGRLAKGISHEGSEAEQAADEHDRVVRETEVHQLCARLGMGMSSSEISEAFRKSACPNDFLDFRAFQTFVKLLKRRADIEEVFLQQLPVGRDGLDEQAWAKFLRDVQGVKLDDLAMSRGFLKYADAATNTVTLDGFVSFLMSSDNAAIKDESKQDMTRPLPEYFISSSHNTYLIGSQFQGPSTVEGYIRALQQGCRSVELDVWDGDDGEPAVTHGHTLTTKIPVRNVLQAIAQYAFLASPYPVILSVEVHCELEQQDKLATILHETLGEKLVSRRLDEMEADKDVDRLPSPADLKGKFLLKAKNKFITTSNDNGFPIKLVPSDDDSSSSELSSQSSSDGDFKNSKFYRAIRQFRGSDSSSTRPAILRSPSSRSSFGATPVPRAASPGLSPSRITENSLSVSPPSMGAQLLSRPALPTKPKDIAMSQALADLLVYTIGVKARGFNKKEKYAPTHVISLGESRLAKMLRDEAARQDFIAHNRGHLTRAYPRGSRLTSSNFAPHLMWAAGVQLVALNWQTFDVGMELNLAMFARAGRCGYVLKPDFLRKKGEEKDKIAALRSEKYRFEVEVISAQQLPRPRGSGAEVEPNNLDPFVVVSLFVPGVVTPQKRRTPVVLGNAFNPTFRSHSSSTGTTASSSRFSFTFSSHPSPGMLDLVFVRFEVLNAKGNPKVAMEEGKGDSVGAYTIGVGALMPGYRHLPLYDSMGDQHLYSTLFIRSKVLSLKLTMPKPASSSGPTRAPKNSIAEASAFPLRWAALVLLLPLALWLYYPSPTPAAPSPANAAAQPFPVIPEAARCPAQVEPLNVGADWHPQDGANYKAQAVERLRDAVRIRTEAFDDMGGPEDQRFEIFLELHSLLEASYPRVFSSLQVEKIRRYGLLITWQGTDPSLKPVVLMAHQDVVPVDAVTASRWTHPPFSAHLDADGWIWGRGTTDCKNTLLGALSAFEKLLEDGHKPTRTIIISSGADEEIGGSRSAKFIAERLEQRYGHDGVAFILDEGISAIDQAYGLTLARLGVAEKGAVSIKLDVLTPGGHSSVPHGSHTGIGVLAKLVTTLEENPELPVMREGSPLLAELQCAADYGRLPPALKERVRDPSQWEPLSRQMAAKDDIIRAFIGTTQAVDLIHGGVKINALPEFATASANYRINFLSSVNATLERLIAVLRPTVESFNLTFDVVGSHAHVDNNVVRFSVLPTTAHEPAPLTPTKGPVWSLMAGTTRHIWDGAVVTPSGMIGGTDTKHCWNLTRHIFRFVPCPLSMALNLHTVDERLHVDAHMSTIRFYYKLIHNLEGWKAP